MTEPSGRWRLAFIAALSLSAAGTAMGLLAATTVTTQGATGGGAGRTALFVSLMMAPTILAPVVPRLGHRLGERRTFALASAVTAVLWAVAGVVVVVGGRSIPVVLMTGALVGFPLTVTQVYKPLVSKAFLTGKGLAVAHSYQGVIGGAAFMVGSLAGGPLVDRVGPGSAMVVNGVLSAPIAWVCWSGRPAREPRPARAGGSGLADIRRALADRPGLRRAAVLAAGALVCLGPMSSMVVPVTSALRSSGGAGPPSGTATGAGLLMAAMAGGRVAAPWLVRRLSDRLGTMAASRCVYAAAGLALVAFALLSWTLSGPTELAVWIVFGVAFGMTYFAGRSLCIGAAGNTVEAADQSLAMAMLTMVAAVAIPMGVIAWGLAIDGVSAVGALIGAGAAMVLIAVALRYRAAATVAADA